MLMKMNDEKLYRLRLVNTKILSFFLVRMAFVRCVILNGSMASGQVKAPSDIDLLIIAKSGRIFTARFLSLFITYLTGLKRGKDDKRHGGKFCLNYFLTEDFLTIPHNRSETMNKYCAENYSRSILMAGDEKLFNKFMQGNFNWMKRYLKSQKSKVKIAIQKSKLSVCHSEFISESQRSRNKFLRAESSPLDGVGMTAMERLLSGKVGDRLEKILKNIQIAKINRDPRTKKYPDLIVVSDNELRFHPPKQELRSKN